MADFVAEHKESMGHLVPRLKRDPTEIFSEQCFITMEAGEGEAFAQIAEMGLAHTVVWGSDYPHYDCTFPGRPGRTRRDVRLGGARGPTQRGGLHERPPIHGAVGGTPQRIGEVERASEGPAAEANRGGVGALVEAEPVEAVEQFRQGDVADHRP